MSKAKETSEEKLSAKTSQSTAVAIPDDFADQLEQDAGAGQEYMGADDFAIPRIGIIQSLSPQRNNQKSEYIEGCEEGQIFENVGKKLWNGDEGIIVIPVQFQKVYLEWQERSAGGGLVANHGRDASKYNATTPNEKGQRITEDKTRIIPTAEYYVMIFDIKEGTTTKAVLSMANTQLKHAKRWNSMINGMRYKHPKTGQLINVPIYYGMYNLKTVPESNEQGSWFRWEIEAAGPILALDIGKQLYDEAKAFRDAIIKGMVKTAEYEADVSSEAESDEDPM